MLDKQEYTHAFFVVDLPSNILGFDFLVRNGIDIQTNPLRLIPQSISYLGTQDSKQVSNLEIIERKILPKVTIGQMKAGAFLRAMHSKFPSIFHTSYHFKDDSHSVILKIEVQGPYKKPHLYQSPYAYKDKVKAQFKSLIEDNIIRPSSSQYQSPIVVVPKADGRLRIAVDYRAVNKVTVPDNYSLPQIETIKKSIKGEIFSAIDLKDGFYQIPVHKESIQYTAACAFGGSYEYLRMPVGLRNAPPTFQRFMDEVVRDLDQNYGVHRRYYHLLRYY